MLDKLMNAYRRTLQLVVIRASHVVTMSKAGFTGGGGQNAFAKEKLDEMAERFRRILHIQGPSAAARQDSAASRNSTVGANEMELDIRREL